MSRVKDWLHSAGWRLGVIRGFQGSWTSGVATLIFDDGANVYCDNGTTVRALASMFPDVIGQGHTVNVQALVGQSVYWRYDDMGLMLGAMVRADDAEDNVARHLASLEPRPQEKQEQIKFE